MNKLIAALCLTALVTFGVVLWKQPVAEPLEVLIPRYQLPDAAISVALTIPLVTDISLSKGLVHEHRQSSESVSAVSESFAAAACVLDFDADGWMDVLLVGGSGHSRTYGKKSWWGDSGGNRLLRNASGQRFVDVTESAGLTERHWGTGCSVADLDGDGDPDLIITGMQANLLFENLGDGRFSDVSQTSGIKHSHWATHAVLGDVNRDGLTDIYVTNLVRFEKNARTFEHQKGFGAGNTAFDVALYDAEPNMLYINRGGLRFDVQQTQAANHFGRSLTATWHDVNADSWPDLVVSNGFATSNQLYINQQGRNLVAATDVERFLPLSGSRGLLIDDFLHNDSVQLLFLREAGKHNLLLESRTEQGFMDIARDAQLAGSQHVDEQRWGAVVADFNNDGFRDLYLANGRLYPDPDSQQMTLAQPNRLMINTGKGTFVSGSGEDPGRLAQSSRGVASIDVDNDGQLEVLVANNNGPFQLLSLTADRDNFWLGVDLGRHAPHVARVELKADQQLHRQDTGFKQGLFGQSDPRVHFGLGTFSGAVSVVLHYNDGRSPAEFGGLASRRYYRVTDDGDKLVAVADAPESLTPLQQLIHSLSPDSSLNVLRLALLESDQAAIEQLWPKLATAQQVQVLNTLEERRNLAHHWLLDMALRSDQEAVLSAAISTARKMEWDWTIARMIARLPNTSDAIRCQVANTFQHFYDEEEAAIRVKYLAISPMLELVSDLSPTAQVCVLQALGASESKRAVPALMALLQQPVQRVVEIETIRALGRIRDARASELIAARLASSTNGEVLATALIALSRLNAPALAERLQSLLNQPEQSLPLQSKLRLLSALLQKEEGVVLARDPLLKLASALLSPMTSAPQSVPAYFNALQLAAMVPGQLDSRLIVAALDHERLRGMAHVAAYTAPVPVAEHRLYDMSVGDLVEIFRLASESRVGLPLRYVHALAIQLREQPADLPQLQPLVISMSNRQLQDLLTELLDESDAEVTGPLLDVALQRGVAPAKPADIFARANWANRQHLVKWIFMTSHVDDPMRVRARLWLNQVLFSDRVSQADKVALIDSVASTDPVLADTLIWQSETLDTERVLSSLNATQTVNFSARQSEFLNSILRDRLQPIGHRALAAALLSRADPAQRRQYIEAL